MSPLQPTDFSRFFTALHDHAPFPWQQELADRVCEGTWPQVIDLPTASGKTGCLDIALFALALNGDRAPRRIFFVVDRRVVVNEAYERVKRMAESLEHATDGILKQAADALRQLAGKAGAKPVETYEMRGGVYRDESWVKTPLQPTVIASTVDQVGSRLLFRGYGVSETTWPIHAGLIANDALVILDEAHCSRAFGQTLERIRAYRGDAWASAPVQKPFHFVEMTATPSDPGKARFKISDSDRTNETLQQRIRARKPTRLIEVKGKRDDFAKLAQELAKEAMALAHRADARRIAVIVNRVHTAKLVYQRLKRDAGEDSAVLVIGRMRPLDRDELYRDRLQKLKSGVAREAGAAATFVVSTQCLEVGADLDFDVMVTECASIDALLQRFGRLDRLGDFGRALGTIAIGSWQTNPEKPDAVYGPSLARTWEWLNTLKVEGEINMGIEAADGGPPTVAQHLDRTGPNGDELRLATPDAPILLPSHLDVLAQTSPPPQPDLDVALFLHGQDRGAVDVQVVWRADLDAERWEKWNEIVGISPPVSTEAMPVQISVFRRWLAGEPAPDYGESDLEGIAPEPESLEPGGARRALLWHGDEGELVTDPKRVRPGGTFVLPVSAGGWDDLGHIPDAAPKDRADQAAFQMRRRVSLRLHPAVIAGWTGEGPNREPLLKLITREDVTMPEVLDALQSYGRSTTSGAWPAAFLNDLESLARKTLNRYPDGSQAYVLEGRRRTGSSANSGVVFLNDHAHDVGEAVLRTAKRLVDPSLAGQLEAAATFHDYGKADLRFQAWLRGGDVMAAQFAPKPIAKSGTEPVGKQRESGLPSGFRHELLSLLFARKAMGASADSELTLHIIASHHGRCRPFAPFIEDSAADCVSYGGISVCAEERQELAAHRLDSGVPDRFWKLTRTYGWWGLAYLEALFRLADWEASE